MKNSIDDGVNCPFCDSNRMKRRHTFFCKEFFESHVKRSHPKVFLWMKKEGQVLDHGFITCDFHDNNYFKTVRAYFGHLKQSHVNDFNTLIGFLDMTGHLKDFNQFFFHSIQGQEGIDVLHAQGDVQGVKSNNHWVKTTEEDDHDDDVNRRFMQKIMKTTSSSFADDKRRETRVKRKLTFDDDDDDYHQRRREDHKKIKNESLFGEETTQGSSTTVYLKQEPVFTKQEEDIKPYSAIGDTKGLTLEGLLRARDEWITKNSVVHYKSHYPSSARRQF